MTKAAEFTAGPWDLDVITDLVAENPEWADASEEQIEADARLITAAPEMFAILKTLVGDDQPNVGLWLERCREAVALARVIVDKVEGETE